MRIAPPVIVIPVAVADYDHPADDEHGARAFEPLPRVESDVQLIRTLFESDAYRAVGFEVQQLLVGRTAGAIVDALTHVRKRLANRPGAVAMLYWTGHGRAVSDELRLVTQECFDPITASDGLSPAEVIGKLADARISALLVLLDVCQAAAAGTDIVIAAAKRAFQRPPERSLGLSALFSAYPYERAEDGLFVAMLTRLLRYGPSAAARERMKTEDWEAFNPHNRCLTLEEVQEALLLEIEIGKSESPLLPTSDSVSVGRQARVFPNPCYRSQAPAVNVDEAQGRRLLRADMDAHFLPKARGLEPAEAGWFFSGRRDIGRGIVEWFERRGESDAQNLFVLTGSGGTGKSALIGRLVALSDETYRNASRDLGWNEKVDTADGTVPPLGAIDAALHLRKLTLTQVLQALCEMLGLDPEKTVTNVASFVAAAPRTRLGSDYPITIVLDALDEADEPARIAEILIRQMVDHGWRILVATRRSAASRDSPDLIGLLGPAQVRALDDEGSSYDDIQEYVRRRLAETPDSPYRGSPELCATISRHIASLAERKFLFARVTTTSLLRRSRPIQLDALASDIAADLADAFQREVDALQSAFVKRFSRSDVSVAALFAALAYSEGEGLPLLDDIWPKIASAIGEASAPLTVEHARWLLREGGQFIVENGDGHQAVYLLFHERMNEFFRPRDTVSATRQRIAVALEREVKSSGGWSAVNRYVVRHIAAHLEGLDDGRALERLLVDFDWLFARLAESGIGEVITDFHRTDAEQESIRTLRIALTRSGDVLARDRRQLSSQLLARLLSTRNTDLMVVVQAALSKPQLPWLRPLSASLAGERALRWLRPTLAEVLSKLTFSRTGVWAAHASYTDNVVLWNLKRWRSDGPLFPAPSSPFGLALADDARSCLFTDSLGGVFRWSAVDNEIHRAQGHPNLSIPRMLDISNDGRFGLSAESSGSMVAWDFETGQREQIAERGAQRIKLMALQSSGKVAIVVYDNNAADVLVLWPMRRTQRLLLTDSPVALTLSSDDSLLGIAYLSGRIELRQFAALDEVVFATKGSFHPTAIAISSDRLLGAGTMTGILEVWDPKTGVRRAQYVQAHTYEIERLVFSSDGDTIISGDRLHIKEWAIDDGDASDETKPDRISSPFVVSPDGTRAVALRGGCPAVWDLRTGARVNTGAYDANTQIVPCHGLRIIAVARAGSPTFRVLAWNHGRVQVWDGPSCAPVAGLSLSGVEQAEFTPDGAAVVLSSDNALQVWRFLDGVLSELGVHDELRHFAVSPDGRQVLSCGGDAATRLWTLDPPAAEFASVYESMGNRNVSEVWDWSFAREKPMRATFAGSQRGLVATDDGTLVMVRTDESRDSIALRPSHRSWVKTMLVSAEGSFALTASSNLVIVWDLASRTARTEFSLPLGAIHQLSRSGDRFLATTSDGVIKVVSLDDGTVVAAFEGDRQFITCAADPDLEWIGAADERGNVYFFHLEEVR